MKEQIKDESKRIVKKVSKALQKEFSKDSADFK
jgi:hypothetical protein